jgi:capsule polysaccharide export protein KpsE/RkpR
VQSNIFCEVDKKTNVVTITVKDQDPLICATMANETCEKLQEFIVKYRTHKAKIDYEYYKKLCAEAKAKYERARQTYGSYSDANMDIVLESYRSKTEDLENEMQLKYNIYSTLNTQMQMAQAKLQEATPAFTVIQSATVPYKPAGPKRVFISLAMTILAFIALSGWILVKRKD